MTTLHSIIDWSQLFTNILTPIGVGFAAWQLVLTQRQARLTQRQARTTFEDALAKEYRELASHLPTKALLGERLTIDEQSKSFDEFYHYFDLSNEQIFLRQKKRISLQTWIFWKDGILSNLGRPAFRQAWEEIHNRAPDDFSELSWLIQSEFKQDPARWHPAKPSKQTISVEKSDAKN